MRYIRSAGNKAANVARDAAEKAGKAIVVAKKTAQKIDAFNAKYNRALDYIPYAPAAAAGARMALGAADDFTQLMATFGNMGAVSHPGISGAGGSVAGVSNNMRVRNTGPKFRNSAGTIRIIHKELVGTVSMTANPTSSYYTTVGSSVYQVNAGSGSSFSWLAQIAANYDFYRFKRVRLVYVPLCSTNTTGRVMLAYDPDSSDVIPQDRQALSNYSCSAEGNAWGTVSLDCKLTDVSKWYYTENMQRLPQDSGVFYDQGQFFWSTWGGSTGSVGEVYVMYDVELKDPQPPEGPVFVAHGNAAAVTQSFPTNFPLYFGTNDATTLRILGVTAGKYLILLTAAASATGGASTTGGGVINAQFDAYNGGDACLAVWWTVVDPGAQLTMPTLTGLSTWAISAVRSNYQPIQTNYFN